MKMHFIMGVDPGIANTGVSIVRGNTGYKLIDTLHIKTEPEMPRGQRLNLIHDGLIDFLSRPGNNLVSSIAIERAFHNKNVSSSTSTQQVIGIIHRAAHISGIPVVEITPQAVKSACGLGGRATKDDMLRTAQALFRRDFKKKDNHLVDAAFAAVCGILKHRKNGGTPSA